MAIAKLLKCLLSFCLLLQVTLSSNDDHYLLFLKFIYTYKKPYRVDSDVFWHRFEIFKNNLKITDEMNKSLKNETAFYGINKFSDLSQEEFQNKYLSGLLWSDVKTGMPKSNKETPPSWKMNTSRPKKFDWRTKNIISAVKNQESCGACWAFSATETIESMYAKATGEPVPTLAVQEVIDCAKDNYGCEGGDTCSAINWMVKYNKTIEYERDYPLVDKTEPCKLKNGTTEGVRVASFTCQGFINHEDGMLDLLSTVGPLTVTIDASTWKNYVSGIIKFHCSAFNNHAVQIVGYDLTGDVPYYIVRNSWGDDFGDKGYLYIKVGGNLCDYCTLQLLDKGARIRIKGYKCEHSSYQ